MTLTRKKDLFIVLTLFVIGISIRIPFLEKMQSHWDGPQYSIAVIRYSLEQHTPAPPGYPLYIALGRFFYFFESDPHKAILMVSLLFSGLGAAGFYIIGKEIFNRYSGMIASLLFLSGTTFYFFGITSYAYGAIPVISGILALIVYRIVFKKSNDGVILGFIFSFSFGYRPQETPFIILLFLYGFYHLNNRERLKTIASFLLLFIVWFIPFMQIVGGLDNYLLHLQNFLKSGAIPVSSIQNYKRYFFAVVQGIYFSFGISALFLLALVKNHYREVVKNSFFRIVKQKQIHFYMLWIFPSLIMNLLLRSEHAGYQGTYISALLILISYSLYIFVNKNNLLLFLTLSFIIIFNLSIFFYDRDPGMEKPYRQSSFHYSEIAKNDIRLKSKIDYIRKYFDPDETIIITEPFLWRPIMYYLPEYDVYDLDGLFTFEERYKGIVRESRNWNFVEKHLDKLIFKTPMHARYIVFTDDNMNKYVYKKSKTIELDGNSNITILNVNQGDEFEYGVFFFKYL